MSGWVGFDLDGTLAEYDYWRGPGVIGKPVPRMVELAKAYMARGVEVRIFTARVSSKNPGRFHSLVSIMEWSKQVFGRTLEITAEKDLDMVELYDDRCHRVEPNTGKVLA